ncbi:unannotated protein [freshwater metagenome]|uniref:Unannotated protein n=1 Tax=freshwater metagenome TaxID=449393 RepID=A0A6J6QIA9_9ZZZZ
MGNSFSVVTTRLRAFVKSKADATALTPADAEVVTAISLVGTLKNSANSPRIFSW